MTTTETAEVLGCTRQNVHDLYTRGQLVGPPRAHGSTIRIYRSSVEDYARGRRRDRSADHLPSAANRHGPDDALAEIRGLAEVVINYVDSRVKAHQQAADQMAHLEAIYSLQAEARAARLTARMATNKAERARLKAEKQHLEAELKEDQLRQALWTSMKNLRPDLVEADPSSLAGGGP